jgi:hypothetical protein
VFDNATHCAKARMDEFLACIGPYLDACTGTVSAVRYHGGRGEICVREAELGSDKVARKFGNSRVTRGHVFAQLVNGTRRIR